MADLSAEAPKGEADVAQLAERVLGKDEVTSSILVIGSRSQADGNGWQTSAARASAQRIWRKRNLIGRNRT